MTILIHVPYTVYVEGTDVTVVTMGSYLLSAFHLRSYYTDPDPAKNLNFNPDQCKIKKKHGKFWLSAQKSAFGSGIQNRIQVTYLMGTHPDTAPKRWPQTRKGKKFNINARSTVRLDWGMTNPLKLMNLYMEKKRYLSCVSISRLLSSRRERESRVDKNSSWAWTN